MADNRNAISTRQVDWNCDDQSSPEYIKNKPTTKPVVAGDNVTIEETEENFKISATGGGSAPEYVAGDGITISGDTISVNTDAIQTKLTAGTNIDMTNGIVSTGKAVVAAGDNVTVSSSLDSLNNIVTYTVNATGGGGTTYTAGSGLDLNGTVFSNAAPHVKSDWDANPGDNNEILNKPTFGTGLDVNSQNVVTVYHPVPDSPGQYYVLETSGASHDAYNWRPLMRTRFQESFPEPVITQDNLNNQYIDVKINWDLHNPITVNNTPTLYTSALVYILYISSAGYIRGSDYYQLQSGGIDYIESGIWSSEDPSFYGCELFDPITTTDLTNLAANHAIRRLGQTDRYIEFEGPSFRIHLASSNTFQIDDIIQIKGYVTGLFIPETMIGIL